MGLCFGIGLGLSATTPVASALSCAGAVWKLHQPQVDGDGDLAAEASSWPDELWLEHEGGDRLLSNTAPDIRLARVQ